MKHFLGQSPTSIWTSLRDSKIF